MSQIFEPPKYRVPYSDSVWPWVFYKYDRGTTILKNGASYTQVVDWVDDALIEAADFAYVGGHTYVVSDEEAQSLFDAGFGEAISEPPADQGYGRGPYSSGPYGD